jgi:hypothetical protein
VSVVSGWWFVVSRAGLLPYRFGFFFRGGFGCWWWGGLVVLVVVCELHSGREHLLWPSFLGHTVDALVPGADEGRGRLR